MVILWVDEDAQALERQRRRFEGGVERFLATTSASEALTLLHEQPVDLLVCARRTGLLPCGALLRIVERRWPQIERVVIDAAGESVRGDSRG